MSAGPPPSEAGPSKNPYSSLASSTLPSFEQTSKVADGQKIVQQQHQPYYSYLPGWANAWTTNAQAYPTGAFQDQRQYQYNPYSHYLAKPLPQASVNTWQQAPQTESIVSPEFPLDPPNDIHRHWDSAIRSFLDKMGLQQALKGFELDMLVMNPDWERNNAPAIVEDLITNLSRLKITDTTEEQAMKQDNPDTPLDVRKLDYVYMDSPRPQSSTIKEVSKFLAQNRSRNAASNRAEFLNSIKAHKGDMPTCARTDAKPQDRDLQMKYDIAKNEDGPLRRTMRDHQADTEQEPANPTGQSTSPEMAKNLETRLHPGIDERLRNIETHFAIRYVPSIPQDFSSRLKFLEDHIIRLERDYPPWAALHFNQPSRGWPPPPRSNPVIVPTHLRGSTSANKSDSVDQAPQVHLRGEKSSLHQAVMERLEVQQAMGELNTR